MKTRWMSLFVVFFFLFEMDIGVFFFFLLKNTPFFFLFLFPLHLFIHVVVDQLISDLNRMERIKKDKMLQREKLSKDIAKYKVQVQQVKDKLKTAKDILEEEKEQQKMDL